MYDLRDGEGTIDYLNEPKYWKGAKKYKGTIKNGLPNGNGVLFLENSTVKGKFKGGCYNKEQFDMNDVYVNCKGTKTYKWPKMIVTGKFRSGNIDEGTIEDKNGNIYEGKILGVGDSDATFEQPAHKED